MSSGTLAVVAGESRAAGRRAASFPWRFPLERSLAALGLVILFRGVTFYPVQPGVSVYVWRESFPWPVLLALGVYAYFAIALVPRWGAAITVARRSSILWLFVALVFLSATWSVDQSLTAATLPIFVGGTVMGLYLATVFPLEDQLRVVAGAAVIAAVASLILVIFWPETAIRGRDVWRGIFENRSAFARVITLGAGASLMLALRSGGRRLPNWLVLLSMVALVILSASSTGVIVVVALVATTLLGMVVSRFREQAVAISLLGVVVAAAVALAASVYVQQLLTWLERSTTLSGRTEIWTLMFRMAERRPWLGYGYSAFWQGEDWPSGDTWAHLAINPGHAHNGFLEVALGVGFLGLTLLIFAIILALGRWARTAMASPSISSWWPLVVLVYVVLWNTTESQLLNWRHPAIWGLLVMAILAVPREEHDDLDPESARLHDIHHAR